MASNARQNHVSPGVYSREMVEIPKVEETVGFTSLGLVGETISGPAFEPTQVRNWEEFVNKFGGKSTEVYTKNNTPRYELPYVAESYLTNSERLNVCRVLGMSGYNAGPAWVITAHKTTEVDDDGDEVSFENMAVAVIRSRGYYRDYEKYPQIDDCECSDAAYDKLHYYVGEYSPIPNCKYITHYNPSALTIDLYNPTTMYGNECAAYSIEAADSDFNVDFTNFGRFTLKGTASSIGHFEYSVTLNPADSNYILKVLGTNPNDGTTPIYVESLYDVALQQGVNDGSITVINSALTFYDVCYPADLVTIPPVDGLVEKEEGALRRQDVGKRFLYSQNYDCPNAVYNKFYYSNNAFRIETTIDENNNPILKNYDMEDGSVYTVMVNNSNCGKSKYLYAKIYDSETDTAYDNLVSIESWEEEMSKEEFMPVEHKGGFVFNNSVAVYNKKDGAYYTLTPDHLIKKEIVGMVIDGVLYEGSLYYPNIGKIASGKGNATARYSYKFSAITVNDDGEVINVTTENKVVNIGSGYMTGVTIYNTSGTAVKGASTSDGKTYSGYIVLAEGVTNFELNEESKQFTAVCSTSNKIIYKAADVLSGRSYTVSETRKEDGTLVTSTTKYIVPSGAVGVVDASKVATATPVYNYTARLSKTKIQTPSRDKNYATATDKDYYFDFGGYMKKLSNFTSAYYMSVYDYGNANGTFKVTCDLNNYKSPYRCAVTPWILSNITGDFYHLAMSKLFRFYTISDGADTNNKIKISITDILPNEGTFTVQIRDINDTDDKPIILESFNKCDMIPGSPNYIAFKIGSFDGMYERKSEYVVVEVNENLQTRNSVPAGFEGYPIMHFDGVPMVSGSVYNGDDIVFPAIKYNIEYDKSVNNRKQYFGLSDISGVDVDMFTYKGIAAYDYDPQTMSPSFHLDSRLNPDSYEDYSYSAMSITVDGETGYTFNAVHINNTTEQLRGAPIIGTEEEMADCIYNYQNLRKFTLYFYGGFDGWDEYRTERTVDDNFYYDNYRGDFNIKSGEGFAFRKVLTPENLNLPTKSMTSDYYAFLSAARMYSNPESVSINVLATTGFDCINAKKLSEEVIDMVEEERGDTLYIMTLPDKPQGNTHNKSDMYCEDEIVSLLEDTMINSSYACVYYPWVKYADTDNNQYIYLPPTKDVVRNIAIMDNSEFPWFAPAGTTRGKVKCLNAKKNFTVHEEDILYEGRINFIKTLSLNGAFVWGQKTLLDTNSPLTRISIRRLMLYIRQKLTIAFNRVVFENINDIAIAMMRDVITSVMGEVQSNGGITEYKYNIYDTEENREQMEIPARIYIKPVTAIEYIPIDLVLRQDGVKY